MRKKKLPIECTTLQKILDLDLFFLLSSSIHTQTPSKPEQERETTSYQSYYKRVYNLWIKCIRRAKSWIHWYKSIASCRYNQIYWNVMNIQETYTFDTIVFAIHFIQSEYTRNMHLYFIQLYSLIQSDNLMQWYFLTQINYIINTN